ncbi:MAG: cytochrome c biogenesis protein CcdA [Syntrophobacteraceae bacterium]|jgi:thiol:disulfide interchange protein DsbD
MMMKLRAAALVCVLCPWSVALLAGVAPAAQSDAVSAMSWPIFSVFLWGMALNLTPCVYPLIPITISYFSAKSIEGKAGRGRTIVNALLYVLGIALMNSILGVFAALSGRLLGTLLGHPVTLVLVALVMLTFALSMFGVWEFRLPAAVTGLAARNYAGYFGSLVMGLTLGIVAAPCIGPFVAGVLVMVANIGDPVFGFWVFFSLSMGMGFPLFVLALLSDQLKRLPKSGEWMLWVRKIMGWVMIGAAAYFISPLMPYGVGTGLLAAVAVAAGINLGWIESTEGRSSRFWWIKKGVGIVCIGFAGALIWSAMPSEAVRWTPFSDTVLSEAKESGRPVIIDFYADWCSPCRRLEKFTFHDRSIIDAAAKDFIMIRVDLTHSGDGAKERLLRLYNVLGVPTVVFLKPGGDERTDLRVMNLLPPDEFLKRMNQLKTSVVSREAK